jgi:hypothetical protein
VPKQYDITQVRFGHLFVVPGTNTEIRVNTSTKIIEKLTKKDVVVVSGGRRDVGRN